MRKVAGTTPSLRGLPQNNLKIQVVICVFLASGNKIPRLPSCKQSIFFWRKCLILCNERVPFLGKILVLCNKGVPFLEKCFGFVQ
jgi:hypothetical protein